MTDRIVQLASQRQFKTGVFNAFLQTCTTHTPIRPRNRFIEHLILEDGDPLRWLVYKDTGEDPGLLNADMKNVLRQYYLVDYWGLDKEQIEAKIAWLPAAERPMLGERLVWIRKNLRPYINRWEIKEDAPNISAKGSGSPR